MGVQGFHEYIEKHCPSAVVSVELQKLARGSMVGGGRPRPPPPESVKIAGGRGELSSPALRRLLHRLGQQGPVKSHAGLPGRPI